MRSGYSDACDMDQRDLAMWRGRVASAIRGKRGQQLLRDAMAALDAMPDRRLIKGEIEDGGEVCLLGATARYRGVPNFESLDPENHEDLAGRLDAATCLIQEIEYINDELGWKWVSDKSFPHRGHIEQESPEERFVRVRKWLEEHIEKAA